MFRRFCNRLLNQPLVELAIRRKLGQKPLILKCLRRFPELSHGTM